MLPVDLGHNGPLAPVTMQDGSGFTVRITSSLLIWFAHGPESVTVSRSVTVLGAPEMVTPVDKVLGELMVTPAQPDTHDQVVEVIG